MLSPGRVVRGRQAPLTAVQAQFEEGMVPHQFPPARRDARATLAGCDCGMGTERWAGAARGPGRAGAMGPVQRRGGGVVVAAGAGGGSEGGRGVRGQRKENRPVASAGGSDVDSPDLRTKPG